MDKLFLARLAMNVLQNPKADRDGIQNAKSILEDLIMKKGEVSIPQFTDSPRKKTTRKLSAWNKFVKANSNKKIYKFANGKLKLKKMGIAFRKTRAGRKK